MSQPRPLTLICSPMRSQVNLSRIVRMAGCCGLTEIIAIGNSKVDPKIGRDGAEQVTVTSRRTIGPVLDKLRAQNIPIIGLEQTTNSVNLHEYSFPREMALVIGSEREGLSEEALSRIDVAVEIPVWGLPYSYNAACAAIMALYEYCRQYPEG